MCTIASLRFIYTIYIYIANCYVTYKKRHSLWKRYVSNVYKHGGILLWQSVCLSRNWTVVDSGNLDFLIEVIAPFNYFNGFPYFSYEIFRIFGNNGWTVENNFLSRSLMMFCNSEIWEKIKMSFALKNADIDWTICFTNIYCIKRRNLVSNIRR